MHPDLTLMLDDIGREPADRVRMLVAADYAEERAELPSLAALLRELAKPHYPDIFATGSRVYGSPRPDSDWDWVLKVDYVPSPIRGAADKVTWSDGDYQGVNGIDAALRFGPVNLLHVSTARQLDAWKHGTAYLCAEAALSGKPRTRGRAIEVFQAEFRAVGLGDRGKAVPA